MGVRSAAVGEYLGSSSSLLGCDGSTGVLVSTVRRFVVRGEAALAVSMVGSVPAAWDNRSSSLGFWSGDPTFADGSGSVSSDLTFEVEDDEAEGPT